MSDNFKVPTPAELAIPFVDSINTSKEFENTEEERRLLVELDQLTELANMHTMYFAQTGKALSIPVSFEADDSVKYRKFDYLSFVGKLETFSVVKIGRIIGATSVRALCLSFDEVTIFPNYDTLPDDHLLHVPALAIRSMYLAAA